ncbi:MAG: BlaI/MecI/CopY family transcriptional regulator [Planctomycetes bacterium]|nr:BlaI/MecI/CopY family transcriptional regulator [Planctomycetota bacterium]
MSNPPKISDAEWDVMEVLWDDHPQTATQVAEKLRDRRPWSEGTVKTLLRRLLQKGALQHEQEGKRYLYAPAVAREVCVREETRTFLERVFGGRLSPLLARFVEESDLSSEEIDELKALLREKEQGS